MRVLGVDPGLTRMGIGLVDGRIGAPLRMVAVGVIRTPAGEPIHRRLLGIDTQIAEWMDEYEPDAVAVDRGVTAVRGVAVGLLVGLGVLDPGALLGRLSVALAAGVKVWHDALRGAGWGCYYGAATAVAGFLHRRSEGSYGTATGP